MVTTDAVVAAEENEKHVIVITEERNIVQNVCQMLTVDGSLFRVILTVEIKTLITSGTCSFTRLRDVIPNLTSVARDVRHCARRAVDVHVASFT